MRPTYEARSGKAATPVEWSEAEREVVLAETDSILADPAFRRSHRCVALLRSMVQHALAGDQEGIKERTLGIEVFGRDCDYDSNADPIVRMVANEIRKRLAQYYQDSDGRHRVRIRLIPGRYIPEFEFLPANPLAGSEKSEAPETLLEPPVLGKPALGKPVQAQQVQANPEPAHTAEPVQTVPGRFAGFFAQYRWAVLAVALLLAVAATMALGRSRLFPSAQTLVWKPLMQSRDAILICVADNSELEMKGSRPLTDQEKRTQLQRIADMIDSRKAPTIADPMDFDPTTPFADANAAHDITTWLEDRDHSSILRPSSTLTLQDFRNRPVVLVGGFDNPWTVILVSDVRFSPRVDAASGTFWIRDARNPDQRDWARHVFEERQVSFDYAVITRFLDRETGNWILAIAGLGPHGTDAATQLLMDSEFARYLPRDIRSAENFQIVVGTKVINGNTGPPQILASQAW